MTTRSRHTAPGFTLTEALVAVVAIAIISVGLAAIFASVGDTVQRGRRISAINQFAASIERRIRADLNNITRDGFLVIRNEYAGAANADEDDQLIPLSPEEPLSARLRRVDELMFFARGNFVSARGPISADLDAPRSREARIYYGHGQRQLEGAEGFFRPYLDDPNADDALGLGIRSGAATAIGEANPNVNAGDWTLLRHATLLRQPALPFDDDSIEEGDRFDQLADNDLQINGQIAADSIFRSEAYWGEPFDTGNAFDDDFEDFSARLAEAPPTFPSGVVDVATQSLSEIRRRVKGVVLSTGEARSFFGSTGEVWLHTPDVQFDLSGRRLRSDGFARGGALNGRATTPAVLYELQRERFPEEGSSALIVENDRRQSLVHVQHAWMSDALPAASNELTYIGGSNVLADEIPELDAVFRDLPFGGGSSANAADPASPLFPTRSRMRYESVPPGYNADVFGEDALDAFESDREDIGAVLLAAARADQQMVTNSQFIPRCTEFIVEWSFGERYTDGIGGGPGTNVDAMWEGDPDDIVGELIWYGLPRPVADGVPIASLRPLRRLQTLPTLIDDPTELPTDENPLLSPSNGEQRLLEQHLRAELIQGDPDDLEPNQGAPGNSITGRRQTAPDPGGTDGLIGGGISGTAAEAPTTFYFGYGDPRAVPVDDFIDASGDPVANRGFDMNGDGFRDDLDGDGVYDDEWPWPRLIRITMSFADPVDQTIEDTFQFVVELPRDGDL
ncbi:MAG: type II secretion system protein [Planctomycetota bacterium]